MDHKKLAADCWRLIRALADPEVGTSMVLKRDDDFHAAAENLIEMACDAAGEAEQQRCVAIARTESERLGVREGFDIAEQIEVTINGQPRLDSRGSK